MSLPLSLRTVSEWRQCNTPLSTSSDEAARALDALQLQQFRLREDDKLYGGIAGSLEAALAADPDCILAKIYELKSHTYLLACSSIDPKLIEKLESLEALSNRATWWEKNHIKALRHVVYGRMEQAALCWEDILATSPKDSLAADSSFTFCLHTGDFKRMEGQMLTLMQGHPNGSSLYGYALGRYGFALQENNKYSLAEEVITRALQANQTDTWSIHSMAHVFHMQGFADQGARFLHETRSQWTAQGNFLTCHNNWHAALFELAAERPEAALAMYDSEIFPLVETAEDYIFPLSDAISLLTRLQSLSGKSMVGEHRWKKLIYVANKSLDKLDHTWLFYDWHLAMLLAAAGQHSRLLELVQSLKSYSMDELESSGHAFNRPLSRHLGLPLFEGLLSYAANDYEKAADSLFSLRWKLQSIGGSTAQRDVFNFVLGDALCRSGSELDLNRARMLLCERAVSLCQDPMSKMLMYHDLE